MIILAIDPGNIESGYCIIDNYKPVQFGKVLNSDMRDIVIKFRREHNKNPVVVEMIASYGMPVGATVFDTCVWIGRFTELAGSVTYIYRKDEKINICGSMKAKDTNIRHALMDRFGVKGIKAKPGFFFGFKSDIWSSFACGITYLDMLERGEIE